MGAVELPQEISARLFDLDGVLTDTARVHAAARKEMFDSYLRREHLAGRPAPDVFLAAARALGVDAPHAAVFEDALAGVAAGRAGGFGYTVGMDRVGQADQLVAPGADTVVSDLADLKSHR